MYKPAGINKHFSVALVAEKLSEQLGKPVYASAIWKKLESLYNLSAVEDREEAIPFSLQVRDEFKTKYASSSTRYRLLIKSFAKKVRFDIVCVVKSNFF